MALGSECGLFSTALDASPEQVELIGGHSSSCSNLIRHQTSVHESYSLVEVSVHLMLSELIGCAYAAGAVNHSTCVYCAAGTFSTTAGEKASSCHVVVGIFFKEKNASDSVFKEKDDAFKAHTNPLVYSLTHKPKYERLRPFFAQ